MALMELTVLKAPCGHGRYVGTRAYPLYFAGSAAKREGLEWDDTIQTAWRWEWQDTAFDHAKAAWEKWYRDHPRPEIEPWNPPPLTMTCACGTPIVLTGETDLEDGAEGWSGECPACGLSVDVWDSEEKQLYTQQRQAAYKRAYREW